MSEHHDTDDDEEQHHGGGHEEHDGEHGEPWLVSYADLMTLLFGFFVIMYTFTLAKLDKDSDKMVKMREEVAKFFGGDYVTPYKSSETEFKKILKGTSLENNATTKLSPEGIEVTLQSMAIFKSGSAELLHESRTAIETLVLLIKRDTGDKSEMTIQVEGHTDDVPLRRGGLYPSNWELSGARASAVLRQFENHGFPIEGMKTIGFGASRPLVPNFDESGKPIPENRVKNRRVVIRVMGFKSGNIVSKKPDGKQPAKKEL